jgi:hypothetical protein
MDIRADCTPRNIALIERLSNVGIRQMRRLSRRYQPLTTPVAHLFDLCTTSPRSVSQRDLYAAPAVCLVHP